MTCYQEIACPDCGSNDMMKSGRSAADMQLYRCRNSDCETKTFMLAYRYKACESGIKEHLVLWLSMVAVFAIQHAFSRSTKTP